MYTQGTGIDPGLEPFHQFAANSRGLAGVGQTSDDLDTVIAIGVGPALNKAAAASEHALAIERFHAFNGEEDSAKPISLRDAAFASDRLPEYLEVAGGALGDQHCRSP